MANSESTNLLCMSNTVSTHIYLIPPIIHMLYTFLTTPLVDGIQWGGQSSQTHFSPVPGLKVFVLWTPHEHRLIPVWIKVKPKVQSQWVQHAKDQRVDTCSWHLAVLTVMCNPWANSCCQILQTEPVYLGQEWEHLEAFWQVPKWLSFRSPLIL